ncbi:MAG: ShlB/FhaC/HecB family hemolysin secretion/activation protein [Alphaproteobacteria bacterium]
MDFRIESPHRSAVPRAVDEIRFHVADIRVVGAKTIPPESFRPLYQHLIGTTASLSDILDVADAIEAEYRRAGYPLTRAYVPPQRVDDGIFTINVVEGFVASISVQGGDSGTQKRIRNYLEPALSMRPLTLLPLERGLLMANDLPGVSATGILRPSPDTPGASDLAVAVEQPILTGGLTVDNRGSRFTGRWTFTGDFAFNGLFDDGGQLSGIFATTTDVEERMIGQLRYRHPVGNEGMIVTLFGTVTHGEPGSFLSLFNTITDSWAAGPRVSFPLMRTRANSLIIDAGFTVQDARIEILDFPFSHDEWRVLDIGGSYTSNDVLGGNLVLSFDVAKGLPILGATDSGSPLLSRSRADTDFTKATGALRFTRVLAGPFSLFLGAQGQYSFDPLIAGEQITFGGNQIGRGYEPGAITGDHGLGGTAELRYSARLPQWSVEAVQPYVFFDAAKVWNIDVPSALDFSIVSTGGGIRFWFPYDVAAGVEVARTLEAVPGSDSGERTTKLLFNAAVRF